MAITSPVHHKLNGLFSRRGRDSDAVAIKGVRSLTATEAWAAYEAMAQKMLGISASEFERRWKIGEYRGSAESEAVIRVSMARVDR